MKKGIFSFIFMTAFAAYALYQNLSGSSSLTSASPTTVVTTTNTSPLVQQTTNLSPPAPVTPRQTPPTVPTPVPKGQYTDGTYTGTPANAYYGTIQVEAVITGGKISDIVFLQYPSDRSTSRYVNGQAMPYLKQEAIAAQNAQVNIVSGATDSSIAFRQSLASALVQAAS